MRILLAHNTYHVRGGEDRVLENEFQLLSDHGNEVHQMLVDNSEIGSIRNRVQVAKPINFSQSSYDAMSREIDYFSPEVLHVHNFFPQLTPSIFQAAKDKGIPTVITLLRIIKC